MLNNICKNSNESDELSYLFEVQYPKKFNRDRMKQSSKPPVLTFFTM